MADILTLDQARSALGWPEGANPNREPELIARYIPLATETVEDVRGRMADRVETWVTDSPSPITTPWPTGTIKSVTMGAAKLTAYSMAAGVLTITDPAYTPGARIAITASGLPVPAKVTEAAGIILAHLWNAAKQGRAGGSEVRGEASDPTPRGFAIPRRAEQLLESYAIPTSFAFA